MKLACQENLIPGESASQKWAFAAAIGFEAIELRGAGDFGLERRLPELRQALRDGAVFSTACPLMPNFIGDLDRAARDDAISNLKSQLSVVAELGGLGVITPASYGRYSSVLARLASPAPVATHRSILIDSLSTLGEHAASEGVVVLLEPLNRYEDNTINTLAQANAICVELGMSSVKSMADLYHMNIEESDPPAALRAAAGSLAHIHICDSNRQEPGCGHIDFRAVAETLNAIGYGGYLALECRPSVSKEHALERAVRVAGDALRLAERA